VVKMPLSRGGFRVRDLIIFKIGMGYKFLWNIINGYITLWKDSLMQKYFNNIKMKKIFSKPTPIGGSQTCKSIHQAFQLI